MREVIKHILILFGIPALFFMAGATLNGIRKNLIEKAAATCAKRNNPWVFAVTEFLLYRDLKRKGIVTWIIKHLIKSLQPQVETQMYTFVFAGLMLLGLLVFFLRRRKHIVGEFLLGLARIPLDIAWICTLTMGNAVDKYPPELGYSHRLPKNLAQKMVTTVQPTGSGSGSAYPVRSASPSSVSANPSSSSGNPSQSSGGDEENYNGGARSAPIYVPEKYTEQFFVPDGEYYTAKTADGQTVYYKDPENRPFVDGGLDDISHHES